MQILPQGKPPSQEVLDLMTGLARNPLLLAFWLGPVVWIGVALFEELVRVFFLNCLWKMSDKRLWAYFSILLVALFAGMMHNYQGAFGVVSVCIQGLIMAAYFYRFRRFWPLVISHALFDSVQIIMFVLQTA
jgi:membrane protease YdiL (CAAX protease family)